MPASERLPRLAYAALALLFLISLTYRLRDTMLRQYPIALRINAQTRTPKSERRRFRALRRRP